MNQFISDLKKHLWQLERCYGDPDTNGILEMIYQFYIELNPIDNNDIRKQFSRLEQYFDNLTPEENDDVFDIVCHLCSTHERVAFLEGFRAGARLLMELEDKKDASFEASFLSD